MQMLGGRTGNARRDGDDEGFEQGGRREAPANAARAPARTSGSSPRPAAPPPDQTRSYGGGGGFDEMDDDIPFGPYLPRAAWAAI
jgi:single-strand DNA-binding protein